MNFLNLFEQGGFIMYLLLICSILVWAVAFEKWLFLGKFIKQSSLLNEKAEILIKSGKINEAKGLCHNVHPLISAPYLAAFESDELSKENFDQRLGRRLVETQHGLKRFLWILGTIGSSAPFIGLFGTVLGIIKSFNDISISGKSGFAVVSAGLSEALIATAAGIIVAVIAVMFYNFFQTRLQTVNLHFRNSLQDLVDFL